MLLFDNCSLSEHVKNVKDSFDKSSGRQFEPYSNNGHQYLTPTSALLAID